MRSKVQEARDRFVVGSTRKIAGRRCQRNVYLTDIARGVHNEKQRIQARIEEALVILAEL